MKGIVDRFEGEFAVIEVNGKMEDFPRSQVSPNVQAGDAVVWVNGRWETDEAETKRRTAEVKARMDRLWKD